MSNYSAPEFAQKVLDAMGSEARLAQEGEISRWSPEDSPAVIVHPEAKKPIVIRWSTYRGETGLDIRFHYRKNNQLNPGKRGIRIPADWTSTMVSVLGLLDEVERS